MHVPVIWILYVWEWFSCWGYMNGSGFQFQEAPNFTRYSKATFMLKIFNITYVQPTTISEGVRSPLLLCFVVEGDDCLQTVISQTVTLKPWSQHELCNIRTVRHIIQYMWNDLNKYHFKSLYNLNQVNSCLKIYKFKRIWWCNIILSTKNYNNQFHHSNHTNKKSLLINTCR